MRGLCWKARRTALQIEFDRQVETLVLKGYPGIADVSQEEFVGRVEPLREAVEALAEHRDEPVDGRAPWVLVVKKGLVPVDKAVPLIDFKGKLGFTTMEPDDIARFEPIEGVKVPDGAVYLAVDVDTGKETLSVTPENALKTIVAEDRSPLTLEEGVALATHFPELLRSRNCFMMPGSRCDDRRVAAMWVSKGKPRLGWCWAGNQHSWLGSASCGGRAGV